MHVYAQGAAAGRLVREPGTYEGSSGTSPLSTKLRDDACAGLVVDRLIGLIERASDLRDRLGGAMDYVTGGVPPSNQAEACATAPSVGGVIGETHARLTRLSELLDGIADGVRRLERVVG